MTFLQSVNKALGWFLQGSRDKDLEMGRGHWTVCPVHCHTDPERQRPRVRCRQEGVTTGHRLTTEPQAMSVSGHQKPKMQEGLSIAGEP